MNTLLFFITLYFSFTTSIVQGRESFDLDIGEGVEILSDKAFRKSSENLFEAVGNVIITKKNDSLYGEKASLNMLTGNAYVEGNARYISSDLTAYGTKIELNYKTNFLEIKNAKIISDDYVVLGKSITRTSNRTIYGEDAEYTTCRDCPESWSILGSKVHITMGEYIRITHAFIKVKGVVMMYIPYIILPIKKNRETGLLFPSFSLNFDEGVQFSQPWFYAINNHADMTVTPRFFGSRGGGGSLEYRQVFGERKWLELNSFNSLDQIYIKNQRDKDEENKTVIKSGTTDFRTYNDFEFHWIGNNSFNQYINASWPDDIDMYRDYDKFISKNTFGSEAGIEAFLNYRSSFFDFNIESYFNRNLLFNNSTGFDHRYVQVLPRASLSLLPINLFQSKIPFFKSFQIFGNLDYTVFKQNHVQEESLIRNANRLNSQISAEWLLGKLGPISYKTSARFDHQYYEFPYEKLDKSFYKYGVFYETEAKLELSKIFGVSYRKYMKKKKIVSKEKKLQVSHNILGFLPEINKALDRESEMVLKTANRHLQTFRLKHYLLSDHKVHGSEKFFNQILVNDGIGQFDSIDSIRSKENELSQISSKTELPVRNTIELRWDNSLIKKSARVFDAFNDGKSIRENFDFERSSYFNISQGINLDEESEELNKRLTRLYIDTGVNLKKFNLSLSEYYFYDINKHILNMNIGQRFSYIDYLARLAYDSFSRNRNLYLNTTIKAFPRISFKTYFDYNLEKGSLSQSRYSALYSPVNNCWKLEIGYSIDKIKKALSFNFYVNFNENNFTGLSGLSGK